MKHHFEAELLAVGSWTILRLPESESLKLPSRGQTMVEGTVNDFSFRMPLEPDGRGGHWFRVDKSMLNGAKAAAGDSVTLSIRPISKWMEPDVPADLKSALAADPQARSLWQVITPMARWEWIRWIRSTSSPETRQKRIMVACSKLDDGERRPCCWNRNLCTEPSVSTNGVLDIIRRTGDVVRR